MSESATRPTEEDIDALELLLANDWLDERSARFIEDLAERLADDRAVWTMAQAR